MDASKVAPLLRSEENYAMLWEQLALENAAAYGSMSHRDQQHGRTRQRLVERIIGASPTQSGSSSSSSSSSSRAKQMSYVEAVIAIDPAYARRIETTLASIAHSDQSEPTIE
jgi:hypothetical protein